MSKTIYGFRAIAMALSVAIASTVAIAQTANIALERGVDRRGNDYDRFTAASPRDCAAACRRDERCRAFTYVLPNTIQGPQGWCWLKSAVPPPTPSNCCVSGIKLSQGQDDDLPEGPGTVEPL